MVMFPVEVNVPAAGEGFVGADPVPAVLPELAEGVVPFPVLGAEVPVVPPHPLLFTTTIARTMIVRDLTIRESLLCIRHLYPAAAEAAIPSFRAFARAAH
jgi:hypothetical protein